MAAALQLALLEIDDLIAKLTPKVSSAPSLAASKTVRAPDTSAKTAAPAPGTAQSDLLASTSKGDKNQPQGQAALAVPSKKSSAPSGGASLTETFAKARLAVGAVVDAEELQNSDKLYRCRVDVGGGETRQIIAGLRKHVIKEELQGRLVVVVLNLKTAKLAGEESQGMILAAVQKGTQYDHGELVKPISPPGNACVGDPVFLEGQQPADAFPKEFKHWKKLLPHFSVAARKATLDGITMTTKDGPITADSLIPDGAAVS